MTTIKLIALYLWNILRVEDRAANVILLLRDPRETISSSAGKAMLRGALWACVLCKFLNLFQKDHCLKSIDRTVGDEGVIKD